MAVRMTFQMPNTQIPAQGPVGIPIAFDFTTRQQISGDLALEQMQGAIEFVQSIFIDNRFNVQPFTISFGGMGYTIQVKPGRQGIWPVLAANGAMNFSGASNGGIVVPVIMFNTMQPYFYWDT